MGRIRLADALTDFGLRVDAELTEVQPEVLSVIAAPPPPPAPFDPSDMIAEAVRRAEDALRIELRAEHEAEIAAMRARHDDELAEAVRTMGDEAGIKIGAALAETGQHLANLTTDTVARLLAPVLTEDLTRRTLASLAQAIATALEDDDAIRLQVRGPRPLFERLAGQLGERAGAIRFEERDGFDLTVAIDDRLYETRLGEWSSGLAEMLQ
ncbi:MAG: hypothetical protein JNL61_13415 [Rhizobiaceae bacterium]|nr:hypothetical protein [Rhizobiaceae bacterium]